MLSLTCVNCGLEAVSAPLFTGHKQSNVCCFVKQKPFVIPTSPPDNPTANC